MNTRTPAVFYVLTAFTLAACAEQVSFRVDRTQPEPPVVTGDDDDDPPIGDDDDDDDDDDDPTLPDDCSLPVGPAPWTYLTWVPPSEEFVFDDSGYLFNVDAFPDLVWRTPFGGPHEIVAPYQSREVAGTRFLLDGDLVVCDEGDDAVVRIGMDGGSELIAGGLTSPNSVAVDDKGQVYVTAYDEVWRLDPDNGDKTFLHAVPGSDLDGLTFSPDFKSLYFNQDEGGAIGLIELDDEGNALDAYVVGNAPADFWNELDGMTTDECGNVYVVRIDGRIWRLNTDLTMEPVADLTEEYPTATSINFGSGVGAWERDHLYVMDRQGGMFDIDIGVRGKWEPHLPGGPAR